MTLRIVLCLILGALVSSCSEPKFDSSNEEAMQESIPKISESLSESDKKNLVAALFYAQFNQDNFDISSYNGLTGREIIAKYKDDKAQKEEREKAELESELVGLKDEYESILEDLSGIKISEQSYKWSEGIFYNGPQVSYLITNETQKIITSLYLRVSAKSPGRTTPWVTETNPYSIKGGLEVGESRERFVTLDDNIWEEMDLVGNKDLEILIEIIGFESSEQDEGDMFYHGSDIRRLERKIKDLEDKLKN
ncbi:MAG: hypothetical protein IIB64_06560 [Proteobacteria bacterium]|nr:hypothetical protein [Pseudomonadota bacterium]